ncbi:MAG: thiamine pyrophosphate-binding protein, partial [Actinomycetota bacterium]
MTVSSYILDAIESIGVDVVFGLPGVHALGMWNALQTSNVRYIGFRHEHSAAHAADGYARASGKPGIVILSTGPGTLNALSPFAEAYVSSSPVIAIASTIPSRFVGKQKGFLHETNDLAPAFKTVTRYHGRAQTADDVPRLLDEAFTASTAGRPGPSLIEIPADFFDAPLTTPPSPSPSPPSPGGASHRIFQPAPEEAIKQAAMLLGLAARPVIWAGGGVIRSGASEELVRVAEQLDAPVVCSFMGKGAFPEDHRLAIGSLVRQPEVIQLLEQADLMLAVGTRFTGMDTGNWQMRLPSQMIHIDIDDQEP